MNYEYEYIYIYTHSVIDYNDLHIIIEYHTNHTSNLLYLVPIQHPLDPQELHMVMGQKETPRDRKFLTNRVPFFDPHTNKIP